MGCALSRASRNFAAVGREASRRRSVARGLKRVWRPLSKANIIYFLVAVGAASRRLEKRRDTWGR